MANPKQPQKPQEESSANVKLVKMLKGNKEADVHPDEVENYETGGYHQK